MNDDLIAVSDALAPELVPMPADAADVCPLCRSGRTRLDQLCFSCERTTTQVARPCGLVIPISYYTTPSRLRDRMHDYKQHESGEVRAEESRNVAAILVRYVAEHRDALVATFGSWDSVVAVPSTHHDDAPALQTAVEANYPDVLGTFERPLIRGRGEMSFNQAAEDGFELALGDDIGGCRLMLVDDTYTTGARLHSAHHTIASAGAVVAAAIVVTRKINPDARYGSAELWDRQNALPFSFTAAPWWAERLSGSAALRSR